MIGIVGAIASAAGLAWSLLRLSGRDRILLATASFTSLVVAVVLYVGARAERDRSEKLSDACEWLADDLRRDVGDFDRLIAQKDQMAQMDLFTLRNSYTRAGVERKHVIGLCVEMTRDCFPMTLGNDTKQQILAVADALEKRGACGK
jgi:hypothetical protein